MEQYVNYLLCYVLVELKIILFFCRIIEIFTSAVIVCCLVILEMILK